MAREEETRRDMKTTGTKRDNHRGKTDLLQLFPRRRNVGINLKRIAIEIRTTTISYFHGLPVIYDWGAL